MSKKITLTFCGMRGEGASVAAAKQDAARKIEEILSDDWTPFLLASGNWMAVVTKVPSDYGPNWGHRLLNSNELSSGPLFMATLSGSRNNAIKGAAIHLAQTVGNYIGLEQYLDQVDMRSLDEYFRFQTAYQEAKAKGIEDQACYTYACEQSR